MKCGTTTIPSGCRTTADRCGKASNPASCLGELVARFKKQRHRDCVVDHVRAARSLKEAVLRAAHSERPDGKMHDHQYRLGRALLHKFARDRLRRLPQLEAAASFDRVHEVVRRTARRGVGDRAVYDIAHRISAYKRLHPKMIYLHAGTAAGARHLGITGRVANRIDFPKALRTLRPDQIEDFLCMNSAELRRLASSA
jgi:hypothetical protein